MGSANARLTLTIVSGALITCVITACRTSGDEGSASILLFNGTGTSAGDVAALEKIMRSEHLDYSTSDSAQMNEMSEAQLRKHRLLIVPGGDFERIGNSLNRGATANIREAVRSGLNYLGICAGAFFAGNSPYNGLNLMSGPRFGFYSAEAQGIRKAPVAITTAGGRTLDQYWEDGPQLTGWGAVVARYPDGTPAVVEGESGNGWMILVGVHPEAPESWRRGMEFGTPVEADNAYAATLIRAAVSRESLPHY
jgi:glutamine amidotransferase-like uncharacterized protein